MKLEKFQTDRTAADHIEYSWVTVLDDSYNANPLSMEMAFSSLAQMNAEHRYLVLGDMGELGSLKSSFISDGCKGCTIFF